MPAFVVATAVIGVGLFGIGLHSQREPQRELESSETASSTSIVPRAARSNGRSSTN